VNEENMKVRKAIPVYMQTSASFLYKGTNLLLLNRLDNTILELDLLTSKTSNINPVVGPGKTNLRYMALTSDFSIPINPPTQNNSRLIVSQSGYPSGSLSVLNTGKMTPEVQLVGTFPTYAGVCISMALSLDGQRLYYLTNKGSILVFDVDNYKFIDNFGVGDQQGLHKGELIKQVGSDELYIIYDNILSVINLKTGKTVHNHFDVLKSYDFVNLSYSHDRKKLYFTCISPTNLLIEFDIKTEKILNKIIKITDNH
jgi:hypothetical protein